MGGSILAGRDRVSLDNGMELRLLSALEVLQARREAAELVREDRERALCSNACLLARALWVDGGEEPLFADGREVLIGLTAEEIEDFCAKWDEFRRNQAAGTEENVEYGVNETYREEGH